MTHDETDSGRRPRLLERLALDRPPLRAWALYDWANSALYTVVITAVFPVFFSQVATAGLDADTRRRAFGIATTLAMLATALLAPLLGAIADVRPFKKRLLAVFIGLGSVATAALFLVEQGDWVLALVLFALANLGVAASLVFYDALLPHVARTDEVDALSTSGYALGYLGGGLCLALCVALIQHPAWLRLASNGELSSSRASLPTRLSFVIVAAWWVLFSIPLFRRVPEPPATIETDERAGAPLLASAFKRLVETLRDLRAYRQAFLLMLAFLIFNDGIGTIQRMGILFGEERHIEPSLMVATILLVQFVGIPFTILFGMLARKIGSKRAILLALLVFIGITVLAYNLDTAREFVAMAILIGMVQGGAQALSRSLFSSMIPKHKSAEYFGLFSTLEKFAGVLGPAIFSLAPSSGAAILSLLGFFVVGGAILTRVDVQAGRAAAHHPPARVVPQG